MEATATANEFLTIINNKKKFNLFLLQKLPAPEGDSDDTWQRATLIAQSLKPAELLAHDAAELLRRLYPGEDIRLFKPRAVAFRCTCNRDRVKSMLYMLGRAEVESILAERGEVEVNCEFCNQRYCFGSIEAAGLFAGSPDVSRATRH